MNSYLSQVFKRRITRPSKGQSLCERASQKLARTIFSALLALIALSAVPYGTVEPWWEAAFAVGVFALGALWIIEGLFSGAWTVREHRLFLPLIALSTLAFLQTLPWQVVSMLGIEVRQTVSVDPYETRLFMFRLLSITLVGVLLVRYTTSDRRLRLLIFTIAAVGVASAFFGIARLTMQRDSISFILPYLKPGAGFGQFINKNHFALLMEMTFGLVLGLAVSGGVRRDRLLIYVALAVVLWTALVLSNSRGGIFSMLCQLIFIMLLWSSARRSTHGQVELKRGSCARAELMRLGRSLALRSALIVCLVAVTVIGVVWVGGDRLVDRMEFTNKEFNSQDAPVDSGRTRTKTWRATWQLIKEHPIGGSGAYWVAIPEYDQASGKSQLNEAHNDYLELLASAGIIGAALAIWFVAEFIRFAYQGLGSAHSFRRATCFGALAAISGVIVHSFLDFGLHITVNAVIMMALIAIATLNHQAVEEHKAQA